MMAAATPRGSMRSLPRAGTNRLAQLAEPRNAREQEEQKFPTRFVLSPRLAKQLNKRDWTFLDKNTQPVGHRLGELRFDEAPGPTGALHGKIGGKTGAVLTGRGKDCPGAMQTDVPGPGAHELPSAIRPGGCPGFSMGPRPEFSSPRSRIIPGPAKLSPGPGAYDVRGRTAAAAASSPKFGFGTALRPLDRRLPASERTPGPAAYEADKCRVERGGDDAGFTIARAARSSGFQAPEVAPGPADYYRKPIPPTKAYTIAKRLVEPLPTSASAPGPGSYTVTGTSAKGGQVRIRNNLATTGTMGSSPRLGKSARGKPMTQRKDVPPTIYL